MKWNQNNAMEPDCFLRRDGFIPIDPATKSWQTSLNKGFTLIELLTVMAIVAVLLAILLPSLRRARDQARQVACMSNLRMVGTAILAYAGDYKNCIPYGPRGRPVTGSNFYTVKGNVTSLVSLEDGAPVGLGLLLADYLSEQPQALFCPGADQFVDAAKELAKVGRRQAQSDYYYRHASVTILSGDPGVPNLRLNDLGKNRNGRSISALAMDVQFMAHPSLAAFGVVTRTAHRRQTVGILFADNSVLRQRNTEDTFTVDIGGYPHDALDKILRAFERADELN